jgi:hypothetical protein
MYAAHALQVKIMENHQFSVFRQLHIQLHAKAMLQCVSERCKTVFRGV